MSAFQILSSLPPGYVVERTARAVLVLEANSAPLLRAAGLEPETGPETTQSDLIGRRPLREIVTESETFVVRSFIHGGLARRITGERFSDPERPFRELLVSSRLLENGITTPRIAAARARRAPIGGWYLDLISKRVEGLMSLTRLIAQAERGEFSLARLGNIATEVGRLVRRFHDLGFVHADLTTENMLVEKASLEDETPRFCTLDLDRSEFVSILSDGRRRDNLRRLLRCVIRRTTHAHSVSVPRLCARFLRGYEPSRTDRHADWTAIQKSASRSRAPHALGWLVERTLGESRATDEKGISKLPTSRPDSRGQSSD